jgi:hypothetical protein
LYTKNMLYVQIQMVNVAFNAAFVHVRFNKKLAGPCL